MAKKIGIEIQDFEKIRINNCFYIDKTLFIKEWWESGDDATILEFKVHDADEEKSLKDTVQAAIAQIEKNNMQRTCLEKEFRQKKKIFLRI